jgi:serine/threonine protein kinase
LIDIKPFVGWTLKEKIGSGAFGSVYRIEKDNFSSVVKQIVIPDEKSYEWAKKEFNDDNEKILEYYKPLADRMIQEINIMQKLNGVSGIVMYHDHYIRKYENRVGWEILIRMEHLMPFDKYISENGLNVSDILSLGIELCEALDACRRENIIHRDIKDSNVLVSKRGEFKLTDFGVSKNMENETHASTVVGTYGFMAPEIVKGEKYDFRSDMYSLGILLYKLFNKNKLPFVRENSDITDMEKARIALLSGKELPNPENANEETSNLIKKACSFDKNDRYLSFEEMKNQLIDILDNSDKEYLDLSCFVGNNQGRTKNNYKKSSNSEKIKSYSSTIGVRNETETIKNKSNSKRKHIIIGTIALLSVSIIVLSIVLFFKLNDKSSEKSNITSIPASKSTDSNENLANSTESKTESEIDYSFEVVSSNNFLEDVTDFYFSCFSVGGDIYKIDFDGNKELLYEGNTTQLFLYDDFIYYTFYDSDKELGSLYKMDKDDGSNNIKICDNVNFYANYTIIDDWIYYLNSEEDDKIYKIKTDGTENEKVSDEETEQFLIYNDYIFYTSKTEDSNIYRINIDGSEKKKIVEYEVMDFDIENGFLYYCVSSYDSDDYGIRKVSIDGKDDSMVENLDYVSSDCLEVDNGWIYYNDLDSLILSKIKVNGNNKTDLTEGRVSDLAVTEDWLGFTLTETDGNLFISKEYRLDIDYNELERIAEDSETEINETDGELEILTR